MTVEEAYFGAMDVDLAEARRRRDKAKAKVKRCDARIDILMCERRQASAMFGVYAQRANTLSHEKA